jgi:hypothetical protein
VKAAATIPFTEGGYRLEGGWEDYRATESYWIPKHYSQELLSTMSSAQRVAVAQAFRKLKEVKKGKWNPGAGSSMLGASKSLSASPSTHRRTLW